MPVRCVFHHFSLPGFETAMDTHGCGWDPCCPWGHGEPGGQQNTGNVQVKHHQTMLTMGIWGSCPPTPPQCCPALAGASRTGCREVISYRGEELKKYFPKGYCVIGLNHQVLLEVHRGNVCVIKGDFISYRL